MGIVVKNIPLEPWIQLMFKGLKNLNLAWVNKIAVMGHTWPFVYQRAHSYEEGIKTPQVFTNTDWSW